MMRKPSIAEVMASVPCFAGLVGHLRALVLELTGVAVKEHDAQMFVQASASEGAHRNVQSSPTTGLGSACPHAAAMRTHTWVCAHTHAHSCAHVAICRSHGLRPAHGRPCGQPAVQCSCAAVQDTGACRSQWCAAGTFCHMHHRESWVLARLWLCTGGEAASRIRRAGQLRNLPVANTPSKCARYARGQRKGHRHTHRDTCAHTQVHECVCVCVCVCVCAGTHMKLTVFYKTTATEHQQLPSKRKIPPSPAAASPAKACCPQACTATWPPQCVHAC